MENRVHLWIGSNFSSEEEYMHYFELDYSAEDGIDSPNYRVCGFCKDLGIMWYDEDFIGVIPRFDNNVTLDEILVDAAVDESEIPLIKAKCEELGIKSANAIFWYQDPELVINQCDNQTYNNLHYMGEYNGD
ncbi:immunity 22 family protein [Proteus vulgaris]|uniref:immunity 22 family protein n=1 Tax=Proteus vulgaris TaxID=585 RepID=UPI0021B0FF19|nr:immunity 22 family protein [Proteus vulgaris]MCT6517990.1 immunity 22 family protein [Proteus vulgaris]